PGCLFILLHGLLKGFLCQKEIWIPDSWHVAFTSGLPLCTTMRGKLLPRNYSGHRYRVVAGGLTGRVPTVACDNVRARFPQLFAHLPAADCSFGVLRNRIWSKRAWWSVENTATVWRSAAPMVTPTKLQISAPRARPMRIGARPRSSPSAEVVWACRSAQKAWTS